MENQNEQENKEQKNEVQSNENKDEELNKQNLENNNENIELKEKEDKNQLNQENNDKVDDTQNKNNEEKKSDNHIEDNNDTPKKDEEKDKNDETQKKEENKENIIPTNNNDIPVKEEKNEQMEKKENDQQKIENNSDNVVDENNNKINPLQESNEKENAQPTQSESKKISLEEKILELETQNQNLKEENSKLKEYNTKLINKIYSLRENTIKLKEIFDKDIYQKMKEKSKLLEEAKNRNEVYDQQIKVLIEDNNKLKCIKEKFDLMIKNKVKSDTVATNQENLIKNYEELLSGLSSQLKEKEAKYKRLDKIYLDVIKVIDEQKKIIYELKVKNNKKDFEIKDKKMVVLQKEQEISLLREFINNYKIKLGEKRYKINFNSKNNSLYKSKNNLSSFNILSQKVTPISFLGNSRYINNLPKLKLGGSAVKYNGYNSVINRRFDDSDEKEDKGMKDIREISNKIRKMIII